MILAGIAVLVRATSVRLPFRAFFQLSGLCLFTLAVVFAGNAVFELQNAGILVTTPLAWLGGGFPLAGLYPNVQVASVQGLLRGRRPALMGRDPSRLPRRPPRRPERCRPAGSAGTGTTTPLPA